jgi:uncharacterized delta-60 repeat protein
MNALTNIAGELDQHFGNEGIFTLTLASYPETIIFGTLIDPATQAIYFTGQARMGVTDRPYFLGRLLPDGSLDNTFATQGIAAGKFSNSVESWGKSIALLAQSKILLIGAINSSPALARFLHDGSLDTSYGVNGHLILRNPSSAAPMSSEESASEAESAQSSTYALQDGRILISFTYTYLGTPTHSYVYLLDNNGELDLSFNQTGWTEVKHPSHAGDGILLNAGLIDEDGNIVVCGRLKSAESRALMVVRYKRDGSLDLSFGVDGFVLDNTITGFSTVTALANQGNKRILGIGYASTDSVYSGLLISLEPDGTRNIQFNSAKPLLTRLNDADTHWSNALKQPNGSLVVTGNTKASGNSTIALARLQSNGAFDPTFNKGQGWVVTPMGLNNTWAMSLALQSDGKILVAGFYRESNLHGIIVRYLG